MTDAILLLELDHAHADRLLELIEQQLDCAPAMDLDVLQDILDYFLDYPDQCHHPVEDLVYRHMHARDPLRSQDLERTLEEHAHISEVTRVLGRLVKEASDDPNLLQKALPEQARYFVNCYRQHMRAEETQFFPLARLILTKEDWDTVDFDLFDRRDPLHDIKAESRFRKLRSKIEATSEKSLKRAAALREARQLRGLQSVDQFNAAMTKARRPYVLTRQESGGYSLREWDDVLIDIPECSEARAAWCAWFYLQSAMSRQDAH